MDIILSKKRIDLQHCDVLVLGFLEDERPLRGARGWIDWRLNGRLSHYLIGQKVTGNWKETVLIPSEGRVASRMILLLGLGKIKAYSYLRLRDLSPYLLKVLRNLKTFEVCLSFPYGEHYNVDCGKGTEVLIEGIGDCFGPKPDSQDEEWLNQLRLIFAEEEEWLPEIMLGVQTAKSIFQERFRIRILSPSARSSL